LREHDRIIARCTGDIDETACCVAEVRGQKSAGFEVLEKRSSHGGIVEPARARRERVNIAGAGGMK
jgi:hypothetical protein